MKSKVAIPNKEKQKEEVDDDLVVKSKEVPSSIKVKPRVLPPSTKQANKNLLLKAVAEAHRSIAQTPLVGTNAKVFVCFLRSLPICISNFFFQARCFVYETLPQQSREEF